MKETNNVEQRPSTSLSKGARRNQILRRITEDELAAILTAGEKVVIRCFCNMSTVGNLTHVTHEQCSGERCFADVRVAHKAQVNAQGILLVGHGESIDQSNSFIIARGE